MSRILVAFASVQGQTRRIAERIAAALARAGHEATLHDVRHDEARDPAAWDAVIVGAPIRFGRFPRSLERFVREHGAALASRPNAFFSVSLSEMDEPAVAAKCMEDFFERAHWPPQESAAFAGALCYTRYNPILKLVMRHIAKAHRRPTNLLRDYEFTDWDAVDRFAIRFAQGLATPLAA